MAERRFRCCCDRYVTCKECRESEGALRADERKKYSKKLIGELEKHRNAPELQGEKNFIIRYVYDGIIRMIEGLK